MAQREANTLPLVETTTSAEVATNTTTPLYAQLVSPTGTPLAYQYFGYGQYGMPTAAGGLQFGQ